MFIGARRFNNTLEGWNIGKNTGTDPINMASMFRYATAFNQPLEGWETNPNSTMAYVSTFNNMFSGTDYSRENRNGTFNQPLAAWNVGRVEDFIGMFSR